MSQLSRWIPVIADKTANSHKFPFAWMSLSIFFFFSFSEMLIYARFLGCIMTLAYPRDREAEQVFLGKKKHATFGPNFSPDATSCIVRLTHPRFECFIATLRARFRLFIPLRTGHRSSQSREFVCASDHDAAPTRQVGESSNPRRRHECAVRVRKLCQRFVPAPQGSTREAQCASTASTAQRAAQ